jgi:hypothetical protein
MQSNVMFIQIIFGASLTFFFVESEGVIEVESVNLLEGMRKLVENIRMVGA